jgi:hypothetical protein
VAICGKKPEAILTEYFLNILLIHNFFRFTKIPQVIYSQSRIHVTLLLWPELSTSIIDYFSRASKLKQIDIN